MILEQPLKLLEAELMALELFILTRDLLLVLPYPTTTATSKGNEGDNADERQCDGDSDVHTGKDSMLATSSPQSLMTSVAMPSASVFRAEGTDVSLPTIMS